MCRCSLSRRRRRLRGRACFPACSRSIVTRLWCSSWRPKSTTAARKEVEHQEKFTSFFKVGVANRLMAGRDFASIDKTAGGRAADKGVDDLSDVIRTLDKKGAWRVFAARAAGSGRCRPAPPSHPRHASGVCRGPRPGHGRDAGQSGCLLRDVPRQCLVQCISDVAF